METRANFLAVGAFVVVLFLGLLVFIFWLSKAGADVSYETYDIYFDGAVTGLSEGSTVSYRGINVGTVSSIEIDPDNVEKILVAIDIRDTTPVKTDTVATLQMQAITGGARVQLKGGTQDAPKLEPAPGKEVAVIESVPSQIERLMEGAPALVERVDLLISRIAEIVNDENRFAISRLLQNAAVLSDTIAAAAPELSRASQQASSAMASLQKASESAARIAGVLENDAPKLSSNASNALASVDAAAAQFHALVAENRAPIRDFTNTTLYDSASFINDLRELIVNLNRLTTEVGRDPTGFIFGNRQKGFETQ